MRSALLLILISLPLSLYLSPYLSKRANLSQRNTKPTKAPKEERHTNYLGSRSTFKVQTLSTYTIAKCSMAQFPVVLPPLAVVDGVGRRNKKRAGGLPKLLHKFFFKVLRLRPAASSSASEQSAAAAAFEAYYGYRMVDECYYYSYGGAGSASWAGVLFSIPEEDQGSEEGTPGPDAAPVRPSALRKAHSDSERFLTAEAAAVVHLELKVVL